MPTAIDEIENPSPFDFDDKSQNKVNQKSNGPQKGEVKISINKYQINKKLSDNIFKQ